MYLMLLKVINIDLDKMFDKLERRKILKKSISLDIYTEIVKLLSEHIEPTLRKLSKEYAPELEKRLTGYLNLYFGTITEDKAFDRSKVYYLNLLWAALKWYEVKNITDKNRVFQAYLRDWIGSIEMAKDGIKFL